MNDYRLYCFVIRIILKLFIDYNFILKSKCIRNKFVMLKNMLPNLC